MTFEALLLLALLAAALASFFFEWLPVDVTALTLLLALVATGLVPLDEAILGFSNKGVLTIGGLFVLSHALVRAGLLEVVGARLSSRFARRPWVGIAILLGLVALASGLLNNTAVVAMAIPLAVAFCRRTRVSPSKVLIPLSFAAIFGGTLTLIGTSTNLLVSSIVEDAGHAPLAMFAFTKLGFVFLTVGLGYVLWLAPRRLPERAAIESLTDDFDMGAFLTEVRVEEGSKLVGKTVRDIDLAKRFDVTVLAILRKPRRIAQNLRAVPFKAGDVLVVRGATANLLRARNELGVALLSDIALDDEGLAGGEQMLVEALVNVNSTMIGRTLRQLDFRRSFGAFVLAIRRAEATLRERLARTPLRFADTLLIVVPRDRLAELRRNGDLVVTSELDLQLRRARFWWLPVALLPAIMVLAALGWVDLLVGVLGAVVALLVLGVIQPQESYRAVEWRVIFFIAAFIPVGTAMFRSGLADQLAALALKPSSLVDPAWAPWVAVSVLYLVTSLVTEVLTNNAAAVVLAPVALRMAQELGVDHLPLVFAVCFAASASFLTPTGYQTNMMVYGAGHYRFTDFTRFGGPLNLLFWVVASLLVPVFFPFG